MISIGLAVVVPSLRLITSVRFRRLRSNDLLEALTVHVRDPAARVLLIKGNLSLLPLCAVDSSDISLCDQARMVVERQLFWTHGFV